VVRYHAPADASKTNLDPDSVDVVFSNSVLEHVPGPVIEAMFVESARILPPGGVMFHSVNCGDHYAYADPKISQLHYLQFSDADWARWNNAFLYQNRLRASDFTAMAKAAGFTIEVDTSRPHPERLRQLEAIPVHPSFAQKYPREQLAITSIDFVARTPKHG
jgi:ubiquinone/menaquinone biosynthesis C-methylase UbiE